MSDAKDNLGGHGFLKSNSSICHQMGENEQENTIAGKRETELPSKRSVIKIDLFDI